MNANELTNLVNAALSKDNSALEALYKEFYPDVLFVCQKYSLYNDDAYDIAQDTFLTAFSNLSKLQNAEKFKSWLCKIASNKCLDFLKHNNIITFESIDETDDLLEIPDKNKATEDVLIEKEVNKILYNIIEKLPVEQKVTVFMFYYQDYSVKEIADMYNCSENTVRSRLNYAKKFMQKEIEQLENKNIKLRCITLLPFLYAIFKSQRTVFACEIPSCTNMISQVMRLGGSNMTSNSFSNTTNTGATAANSTTNAAVKASAAAKAAGISAGKIAAIATAATAVVAGTICAAIFLSGGNDESTSNNNGNQIITSFDNNDNMIVDNNETSNTIDNEDQAEDETKTQTNNSSLNIDIKDEEYDSTINYLCEDGIKNGNFSFLVSRPDFEGYVVGTYDFKDLDNHIPIEKDDYSFFSYSTTPSDDRTVNFNYYYSRPEKCINITDSAWCTSEDIITLLEVTYSTFDRYILRDLEYMETFKDKNTVEVYEEDSFFVYINLESNNSYTYKIFYQIYEQCTIQIEIRSNDTSINKALVSDIINSFSFEYVEDITSLSNRAFAEDIFSDILADEFNIYLRNPENIIHMEYQKLIYTDEDNDYKLTLDTFPDIKRKYQLITSYEDYDVYYNDGDYILYQKDGDFQITIYNKDLSSVSIEDGYDLVRQLFLK